MTTTQQGATPALIRTNVCKTSFWATDAVTGLRFAKVYTNDDGTRTNSPRLERFAALMMAGPELEAALRALCDYVRRDLEENGGDWEPEDIAEYASAAALLERLPA
ncbi:hypothetical protein AchV4_0061 [Achromobacter phage vB_AchrS_AchV4]|uniref:Uncharacterized protein n=1 Tax=Achromobacter phage vB_AchrS_AchV4 TaxID=2796514 RepID=A0A7T3U6N9_9CAUD|nr:hypothetical protein JT316_gp61 [Achromobacter phage vB_AchrS_AchV4]QPZ53289.1 hypothetical protein AchV4_0061 [Achromobacter phage vB_AchrS_AchV4]